MQIVKLLCHKNIFHGIVDCCYSFTSNGKLSKA